MAMPEDTYSCLRMVRERQKGVLFNCRAPVPKQRDVRHRAKGHPAVQSFIFLFQGRTEAPYCSKSKTTYLTLANTLILVEV